MSLGFNFYRTMQLSPIHREAKTAHQPQHFFGARSSNPSFFPATVIQPKLRIGQPGDKYEREADAVADRVVSGQTASPQLSTASDDLHRQCADCEQEKRVQRMEEEEGLQANSDHSAASGLGPDFAHRLQASKGSGAPLMQHLQREMEDGMGTDFSEVRIHTGQEAVQMSRDIHAKAFTHGRDIYFNAGQYRPHSQDGRRLVAHELAHVVQQGRATVQRQVIQRDPPSPAPSPSPSPAPSPAPSPSLGLDGLTTLVFRYGDFRASLSLSRAVKMQLPVRIRDVGTLTFELSSTLPTQFGFRVMLDTVHNIRITGNAAYNSDTAVGTFGLGVSGSEQVCTLPDREATQRSLSQKATALQTAIEAFDSSNPATAVSLGSAIYELYNAAQQATRRCVMRPRWSVDLGVTVPFQQPDLPLDPARGRASDPSFGLNFTYRF